jgi:hypothetical protein
VDPYRGASRGRAGGGGGGDDDAGDRGARASDAGLQKAWFWGVVIGSVAVAATAVTLGVLLAPSSDTGSSSTGVTVRF